MKRFFKDDFYPGPLTNPNIQFNVEIYKDYVVKKPKKLKNDYAKKINYILEKIVERQEYIRAEIEEGILKIKYKDGILIEKRAPGIRVDKIPNGKTYYNKKGPILDKIRKLGWILCDCNRKNVFYDKKTDKIYIIDLVQMKRSIIR